MSKENEKKKEKRYHRLAILLRPPARLAMKIACGYRQEPLPELPEPFILLSNHTTNLDAVCVGANIPKDMYFVAGEQIFRSKFGEKLFGSLLMAIKRLKGSVDAASLRAMVRSARDGKNLCMFAEGTRSFTGKTRQLHPTTAGLVKLLKANVVTYRISGGYLQFPRWGQRRFGRITGRVVHVYTAEEIAGMSKKQVMETISRDLFENAAVDREKARVRGSKKHLAEGLQTVLFLCPKCGGIDTLHAQGNQLSCSCGLKLTYELPGVFAQEDAPFPSEVEWDDWQQAQLPSLLEKSGDAPIFRDKDLQVLQNDGNFNTTLLETGDISISKNEFCVCGKTYPLSQVQMEMISREDLVFSHGSDHYQLHSSRRWGAYKYLSLFQYLTQQQD